MQFWDSLPSTLSNPAEGRNEQDEIADPSVERKAQGGVGGRHEPRRRTLCRGARVLVPAGFDLFVPLWLAGAINVIGIGLNMLTYLEAEASDE